MIPMTPNMQPTTCRKAAKLSLALLLTLSPLAAFGQEEDEKLFELDAFVVEGSIRESLIEGVEIKRNNFQMVDAIIAEDIGKFPDNNVVEALQRVTGVQVTDRAGGEVSTVSIRGMNDIATTVNGRNIFTASGRSVALADIPASLLNRVDVFKTRSAEHLEQGIAGVIDVKTQRPFYFDGRKSVISARFINQEQEGSYDPNVSFMTTNTWETDAGKFGALINLSYAETNYRDQSVTAGAMVPFTTNNPPPGWGPYERIFLTDGRVTENPIWQAGLDAGLPSEAGSTLTFNGEEYEYVLSRDAVFASDFTGHRERPAANISLQFAPDESSEYTFEAFYNGYRNEGFNSLHFSFVDWWGNLGEHSAELYPGTNIVKSRENVKDVYGFQSGDLTVSKTDSYLFALGGKWSISDNLKLTADLSYQDSTFESDFLAMRTERVHSQIDVDFSSESGYPSWNFGEADDLTNPANWTIAQLYDNSYRNEGDAIEFLFDGDYNADWGIIDALRFGLRYDDRGAVEANRFLDRNNGLPGEIGYVPFLGQRLSDHPELAYQNSGFFDGNTDVPSSWLVGNGHYIFNNHDEILDLYGLPGTDTHQLTTNFKIDEVTTSAYVVADFRTDVGERRLDGQFGFRFVNVDTDMEFFDLQNSVWTDDSTSTDDILPSFTVRYDWTPHFRTRFSYGETLRRPGFVDLNPIIRYVEDVTNIGYGTASGGNPNLRATTSKNYDLAFEYYFEDAGAVYATVFKRKIDGLVVSFRNRVTYEGYDYILSQPDNASNGELDGVEFGWVYFPEELPGILDGFGVQASYTMLDSIQDIPVTDDTGEVVGTDTSPFFGVSDSSYSVVLAYEKEKWNSRLSYVWREDWLNNNEAAQFANPIGVYRAPQQSLDFQLTYNVSDNFKLTFDATNLTDEIYQSYYEHPETNGFGNWLISRTFALGARYSF
ncbi:TonB-dependent receptor [Pelagicoccus sp. SDUM812003]|uniref:TonB-dependent receptor n=1 Tax=Pelagicoccus sp. SDUM812003 TaxID=3041267 RepID=UPI00280D48BF|nr:TonB-dependent receptor [Pelagicoccus sp. SDUM812003]MDQ8204125.1 TonB-dependent receptor [Pelagicoccus sp. SDUM812003]